jgi:hypothetical protein
MMSPLAFIAIVFGAVIFALGLMPNAISTLMDELKNDFSRDKFSSAAIPCLKG